MNRKDLVVLAADKRPLAGIQGDRHLELCLKINNRPKSIILAQYRRNLFYKSL